MSEKLFEADFLHVDIRSMFNSAPQSTEQAPNEQSQQATNKATASSKVDNWENILANNPFNFKPEVIEKLKALGEPFKNALRVLGFKIVLENGSNPILAFVRQEYVQTELLLTGLLNTLTFKAIYNAVAKNLVADSEFFNKNNYNIIYCKDLYTKSAAEMEKYLTLQSEILKGGTTSYSADIQVKNRKVFLQIETGEITKIASIEKRADKIKTDPNLAVPEASNAKLNSLALAALIAGKAKVPTTSMNKDTQDKLVKKLTHDSDKYAAILALSMNTDSAKAKEALNKFGTVRADDVLKAFMRLITNNVIPKGQLNKTDADDLVTKILASRAQS